MYKRSPKQALLVAVTSLFLISSAEAAPLEDINISGTFVDFKPDDKNITIPSTLDHYIGGTFNYQGRYELPTGTVPDVPVAYSELEGSPYFSTADVFYGEGGASQHSFRSNQVILEFENDLSMDWENYEWMGLGLDNGTLVDAVVFGFGVSEYTGGIGPPPAGITGHDGNNIQFWATLFFEADYLVKDEPYPQSIDMSKFLGGAGEFSQYDWVNSYEGYDPWQGWAQFSIDDVVVVASAPVPEPATMLMFGAGVAGLVGRRLRKRR